jgi:hypothetical protein
VPDRGEVPRDGREPLDDAAASPGADALRTRARFRRGLAVAVASVMMCRRGALHARDRVRGRASIGRRPHRGRVVARRRDGGVRVVVRVVVEGHHDRVLVLARARAALRHRFYLLAESRFNSTRTNNERRVLLRELQKVRRALRSRRASSRPRTPRVLSRADLARARGRSCRELEPPAARAR